MSKILLILSLIALIALVGCTKAPITCTEEAKLCPYGEVVGRVAPDCEFAPCADKCTSDDQCKLIFNSCFCEAVPVGDPRNELPLDPEIRCLRIDDCNIPGRMKAVCDQGVCTKIKVETAECTTDADCVPKECCHPTTCTAKGTEENCAAVMCTMSCEPNTLDCGQGSCICQDGKCQAYYNNLE